MPPRQAVDTESGPSQDCHWTTSERAGQILPAMILNPNPIYPSFGRYVLRLHRDSQPQGGVLLGRIEHVMSGDSCTFASGEELLAWLASRAVDQPDFKESK